jgi:hypothetical protein
MSNEATEFKVPFSMFHVRSFFRLLAAGFLFYFSPRLPPLVS